MGSVQRRRPTLMRYCNGLWRDLASDLDMTFAAGEQSGMMGTRKERQKDLDKEVCENRDMLYLRRQYFTFSTASTSTL